MLVISAPDKVLESLEGAKLVHVTTHEALGKIVRRRMTTAGPDGDNAEVHLIASQGWSAGRLLRDYSLLDLELDDLRHWGRYLFFFLGEPTGWGFNKNIDLGGVEWAPEEFSVWPPHPPLRWKLRWSDVRSQFGVVTVSGSRVKALGLPIFWRFDDNAVVVRGDYSGPARVEP